MGRDCSEFEPKVFTTFRYLKRIIKENLPVEGEHEFSNDVEDSIYSLYRKLYECCEFTHSIEYSCKNVSNFIQLL
jgi:hypothetical protein